MTFAWSEDCETAFEDLKQALISELVLRFPQPGKLFIVEVDASNVAIGGIFYRITK